ASTYPQPPPPPPPPPPAGPSSRDAIETPISALPSRFMNDNLLPSPSSFYPGWDFGGRDGNTLPSPLNFQTPVVGLGGWRQEEEERDRERERDKERKRKGEEGAEEGAAGAKRMKG
ncbi:resistance to lethality of mkk1p386 overexpression, partial [Elasticomyces elasticus]